VVAVRVLTNQNQGVSSSISSGVYETDRGLKYQIDCSIPPPLNQLEYLNELVRVLCTEIANRDTKVSKNGALIAVPPLWFTEGLTQNLLGEVRSVEIDLVRRALLADRGTSLHGILEVEQIPPPGIERELFKAKCKLLIRSLWNLPNGPLRGFTFLTSLQPGAGSQKAFFSTYSDVLPDIVTAENWWAEQLEARSSPSPVNRLSARETDERLVQILTMEAIHKDPKTGRETVRKVDLPELRKYIRDEGTKEMLKDRIVHLENLQLIAHQSYLPVVARYIEALNHIYLERFRKLEPSLRQAEALLTETRKLNSDIAASLDQLEAAQMNKDLLFLYRDYFQTFEEVKSIEQTRDTAIKDYLDRFQSTESPVASTPTGQSHP